MFRLRRRLRDLETRVAALEKEPDISHDMPPRPSIDSVAVDVHGMWRERTADYATPTPADVDESWGTYL